MGTISTGIGLASGINSGQIIDQLAELESRPIVAVQGRIAKTAEVQAAFGALSTQLSALRSSGTTLRKPSTFDAVTAASSDEEALAATARAGTAEGSYSFRVARLVQSQQVATALGLPTADDTPVGATSVTLELGDGRLQGDVDLGRLNNGRGVRRGLIEIVDRRGRIMQVDLGEAATLADVADAINAGDKADVRAKVSGSKLVLENRGGGSEKFRVSDLTGSAAADLGIAADTNSNTITGGDLAKPTHDTLLKDLNDGRGVAAKTGDGLSVTLRNGTKYDVDFAGAETLGDLRNRFNSASGGKAYLDLDPAGRRMRVTDNTTAPPPNIFGQQPAGTGSLIVAGRAGSTSASDLRVAGSTTGNVIDGGPVLAEQGSVLLSSLDGGRGLKGGRVEVANAGGQTTVIDLRGLGDVASLMDRVNAANAGVEARLNNAGNGIDLVDTSGGGGDLNVKDLDGTTLAADLGWAGRHRDLVDRTASGKNLQKAWLAPQTLLTDLAGGEGVGLGIVKVTPGNGVGREVDLTSESIRTVGDLLSRLNTGAAGYAVRVNDTGDGLLVEDTSGGSLPLTVEDVEGSLAAKLRIAGESADGKIDGSFEVTVELNATDSLEDVRDKINEVGFAARAEVLDTGAVETPFRLNVTGRAGGELAAFVFDARGADGRTADNLATSGVARARDAAVFVGAAGGNNGGSPVLVTSRSNQLVDVVPGLTLDLKRAGRGTTTVTVARDVAGTKEAIGGFVEGFNTLRSFITENTKFDSDTGVRGVLLGEPVVQKAERQMFALVNKVYDSGNQKYRILADIGVRVGEGAKLEFDAEKFDKAWADDPSAVTALFTKPEVGLGHLLQDRAGSLTDPADGLITKATDTLRNRTTNFEEQIARLETNVAAKRRRLERQYAAMETALSDLQYQQQQLSSLPTFNFSGTSK